MYLDVDAKELLVEPRLKWRVLATLDGATGVVGPCRCKALRVAPESTERDARVRQAGTVRDSNFASQPSAETS